MPCAGGKGWTQFVGSYRSQRQTSPSIWSMACADRLWMAQKPRCPNRRLPPHLRMIRRARHQVGCRSAARGRATAPSVPGGPRSVPPTPPRPAGVIPRPAPSATTWPHGFGTSIGTRQQACHELTQSRIHGEPRLCERGMGTGYSSAKCGRALLPRTRTVCVAVTDPAAGSLRRCILRPPRAWEAGRTSTRDVSGRGSTTGIGPMPGDPPAGPRVAPRDPCKILLMYT